MGVKLMKVLFRLWPLILVILLAMGCQNPQAPPNQAPSKENFSAANEELKALLPGEPGYVWRYFGFAEYSHEMTLDEILESSDELIYRVSGTVGDPSGGESQKDLSLNLEYFIREGKLIQVKREEAMMDSKFDRLTLIQTPLKEGTTWTESVEDQDGVSREVTGTINEVSDTEPRTYTVRYEETGSDYYEERQFRQGTGLVRFTTVFESEGQLFEIGYFLYEEPSVNPGEKDGKAANTFSITNQKSLVFKR